MASIIYKTNKADFGTPPVDNNKGYKSGDPVIIAQNQSGTAPHPQTGAPNIETGDLSRTGAEFFYWNTVPDGSGTTYTVGEKNVTFPNLPPTDSLVLYPQWGVTTGLKSSAPENKPGVTAHYAFYYDESLGGAGGVEPARTNEIIQNCENDFAWMQDKFGDDVDISKVETIPIKTYVMAHHRSGFHAGWAAHSPMHLNAGNSSPSTVLRSMMVEEVVEMLMDAQHKGWGFSSGVPNEGSCGEALSIFLGEQFQLEKIGSIILGQDASDNWLNSSLPLSNPKSTQKIGSTTYGPRTDYIIKTLPFPGNGPGTGCSLLFIYYLFHQLGFSIPAIVRAAPGLDSSNNLIGAKACLQAVYTKLTGDDSDPFACFARLLATAYPPDKVSSIPGPNRNDPWPLSSCRPVQVVGSLTNKSPALTGPMASGTGQSIYVAWRDPSGAILVSVSTTDATDSFTFKWGAPRKIGNGSEWSASTNEAPSLVVQDGILYAAWKRSTDQTVWYSTSSDCVTWAKQAQIPGAKSVSAPSLHLATGAPPIAVAWLDPDSHTIKYTRFPDANEMWGPVFSLGETDDYKTDYAPSLGSAGAADSTLVFVWLMQGSSHQLMYTTVDANTGPDGGGAKKIAGAASTNSASVSDSGLAWKGEIGTSSNIWVTDSSFTWDPPPNGDIAARQLSCPSLMTDHAPAWLGFGGALAYKAVGADAESPAPIFTCFA